MSVEQLIYTDLARGKGLDPNLKGYQVKACSPGLGASEREQLGGIAMHFRQSVYENAPRAAHEREQSWRITTEALGQVPETVLNEFPCVWSYIRLTGERFALTRVCYAGFTHDQRPGNFFAHSLVFNPDILAAHGWNPLALSHAALLLPADASDRRELDTLPDLGCSDVKPELRLLLAEPYKPHLASLLHALSAAPSSDKSVVICLDDWRKSAPLVEALLSLLPPAARCCTTFCTLENDPKWTGPRPVAPTGAHQPFPPHKLIVLCSTNGRSFELWPNEYEKNFIFNFVEGKMSSLDKLDAYAAFAAQCAESDAGMSRLRQHHQLLAKLHCESDRAAWATLATIVDLPPLGSLEFKTAVRGVSSLAKIPEQAQDMLELLLPAIQGAVQSGNAKDLNEAIPELVPLVDQAPSECGFTQQVRALAEKAVRDSWGTTAVPLLRLCGKEREEALKALLEIPVAEVSRPQEDQSAIVDLFMDGMRLALPSPKALLTLLAVAKSAGRTAEVWKAVGEGAVKQILASDMQSEDKVRFLRALSERVPSKVAPDAAVWVRMKLLEASNQKGEQLLAELEALVSASAGCDDADKVGDLILERINGLVGHELAVALGRLAECAYNTTLTTRLCAAYRDALKELGGKQQYEIRRHLATNGVVQLLCDELLADLLAVDTETGRDKLHSWRDRVLAHNDKLLDRARGQVAERLLAKEHVLWLAEELLSGSRGNGAGFTELCESVVQSLPMAALPNQLKAKLSPPPESMGEVAKARLQVLDFLRRLDNLSKTDDWSIDKFPSANPPRKEARLLDYDDKKKLRELCIDSVAETGINTPEQGRIFLDLVELAGDQGADLVAEAVDRLLRGRDDVTQVQVVTAFADHALEGDKRQEWAAIVGAIARKLDRDTRRLLESHLERRFRKRTPKYDERLRHLCDSAGLSAPKKAPPSASVRPEGVDMGSPGVRMFSRVSQAIRKLRGDSGSGTGPGKE